jgi:hypothetical protein
MTTSATVIPDDVAVAAHRALHTQWESPSNPLPASGFGCPDCLPDIRDVLTPVWSDLTTLAHEHVEPPTLDDPGYRAIAVAASTLLHTTWSRSAPDAGRYCTDCCDDIEVVIEHLWPLLRQDPR